MRLDPFRAIDRRVARWLPDHESRRFLLVIAVFELMWGGATLLRGGAWDRLWWTVQSLSGLIALFGHPLILLNAWSLYDDGRNAARRAKGPKAIEAERRLRSRRMSLGLLLLLAPVWCGIIRSLIRTKGYYVVDFYGPPNGGVPLPATDPYRHRHR